MAGLIRSPISRLDMDGRMDGLQRLGAERALSQLAMDLEVSADHVAKPARSRKRSA
jgi:hypothetical protein